MSKDIIVFRKRHANGQGGRDIDLPYELKVWKPGIFSFIPPNKGYKYFVYWFFHHVRIFRNRNYAAYLLYNKGKLVSSCLIIPSHFKWPFMNSGDVQFTYVMTKGGYRGEGIAGKLVSKIIADVHPTVDAFWYVTDTENTASVKVAEKMGFQYCGMAKRVGLFNVLKLNPEKAQK